MCRKFFFLLLAAAGCSSITTADWHPVSSPDGRIEVFVHSDNKQLSFSVLYGGAELIAPSAIGLELRDHPLLGSDPEVVEVRRSSRDRMIEPVVREKYAQVHEYYSGLMLTFATGAAVEFRVFNDGFGYRFHTEIDGSVDVLDERLELHFPSGSQSYFPEEESFISHNERHYHHFALEELDSTRLASLPLMAVVPEVGKVLLTDADLFDYPGMWMRGAEGTGLRAVFPKVPLKLEPNQQDNPDRNQVILDEADYIARTEGKRSYPWRAFIVSDRDGTFIESKLVWLLSRSLKLKDSGWIKPGRVAWDWFNALNLFNVDFVAGINNRTYEYYIDFAAEFGLEYVILDEGWSISTTDVSQPNPDIDVPALVAYGAERGVDIILWSLWGPLEDEMDVLFDLYQEWGVRGVKIDFMQRSDQAMVQYYAAIAEAAAKRELLISFHGSFKPSGLRRAWPNVITYEGVKGNEYNKWSDEVTARHNVTIPFTRMAAGPMDYTPGAMVNAGPRDFRVSHFRPMTQTTRAHEVAKSVVFESALQMLCDSPSHYYRERETTAFLTRIPSVWDDTKVLEAAIGEYVVVARRSGDLWFIGAMTNEEGRQFSLDLSALQKGEVELEFIADGKNAHNYAEDYVRQTIRQDTGHVLEIELAANGGWAAILRPLD